MDATTAICFAEAMLAIADAPRQSEVRHSLRTGLEALRGAACSHTARKLRRILRAFAMRRISAKAKGLRDTGQLQSLSLQSHGLTPRECEVLYWVKQGKRDREVAAILGVAERTARKHVEHIRAKLHVETRMGAVAAAEHLIRSGDFAGVRRRRK